MNLDLTGRERGVVFALAVLTVVAHLLNLGLMPLYGDEAIRGSVAFEMMKRDNYIVPTIWGEFYYRKPPLYNWLMIGFFAVTGSFSEFVLRLPSVIPLMAFGWVIWRFSRQQIGERAAVLAAFGFVLSGRLLTRDSMLGHIDIFFSLITFLGFYSVFFFWRRSQWWKLFLASYFLAATGVLMKGLPSFLFQGLTLFAWFLYKRQLRSLFTLPHLAGIALFAGIVGGYFYLYSDHNDLVNYFVQLYDQSSQRTVIDRKWYEGLLNILTFPFENFGHLFPTSLFMLFAFRRGAIREWLREDYTAFTLLTLVVNILPYWLSPGYYPRYLFMLYPLVFILGAREFVRHAGRWPRLGKVVYGIFFAIGCVLVIGVLAVPFFPFFQSKSYMWWTVPLLAVSLGALFWAWFRWSALRMYWSLFFLVIFRLGFDLFVIPYRVEMEGGPTIDRKREAEKILALTEGRELRVLGNTALFIEYAYYLGVGKDAVMVRDKRVEPGVYYLARPVMKEEYGLEEVYRFDLGYRDYEVLLVKTKEAPSRLNP